MMSWRAGSVVKTTCSCKGQRFESQHPHGVPQSLEAPGMHVLQGICRQNTHTQNNKIKF